MLSIHSNKNRIKVSHNLKTSFFHCTLCWFVLLRSSRLPTRSAGETEATPPFLRLTDRRDVPLWNVTWKVRCRVRRLVAD